MNNIHCLSSISQNKFLNFLFKNNIIKIDDNIVLSKSYGGFSFLDNYLKKTKEKYVKKIVIDNFDYKFIDFSNDVLGDALGVASGICLANNKLTWVNSGDACLQMGSMLEAIEFIGEHNLNIKLTVDFNSYQLTSKIKRSIEDYDALFKNFGWNAFIIKNNDFNILKENFRKENKPTVFLIETNKKIGNCDPIDEHYKIKEDNLDFIKKYMEGLKV